MSGCSKDTNWGRDQDGRLLGVAKELVVSERRVGGCDFEALSVRFTLVSTFSLMLATEHENNAPGTNFESCSHQLRHPRASRSSSPLFVSSTSNDLELVPPQQRD